MWCDVIILIIPIVTRTLIKVLHQVWMNVLNTVVDNCNRNTSTIETLREEKKLLWF